MCYFHCSVKSFCSTELLRHLLKVNTECNSSPWSSLFLKTLGEPEEKHIPKVMLSILGVLPRIKLSEGSCCFSVLLSRCGAQCRAQPIMQSTSNPTAVCKELQGFDTCKSTSLQKWKAPGLKSFKLCFSGYCNKLPWQANKTGIPGTLRRGFLSQGNNNTISSPEWMFAVELHFSYSYHSYLKYVKVALRRQT